MNSPDTYTYVSAQVTQSAATRQVLKCSLRTADVEDILLIRKDSLVLLCQEDESLWLKHVEQELQRPIKNALILQTTGDKDTLVLCDDTGSIYFLSYEETHFSVIRRFGSVQINESSANYENYQLSLDPLGRALCSLSSEDEITVYSMSRVTDRHELMARNIFQISGLMLQSCFLTHSNNIVSLIVHVSAGSWAKLVLIHWKSGEGLQGVQPREMPLDAELSLCLHVLGLKRRLGYFLHVTPTCLSIISSHHVQCGDLNFERCALELSGGLPTSLTEVSFGNEEHIALLASDTGEILLIALDVYGNLSATSIGFLPITPTSLCLLATKDSERGTWTIFAASENGHTGVFVLQRGTASTATTLYVENLPVRDVSVHESEDTAIQSRVVTVAGNRVGSMALHRLALVATPIRDIQLPGLDRTPENMFSVCGRYGIAYVLISMPWASQLLEYSVEEGELTDVSADFDIETTEPTLFFCVVGEAFGKSFLQVTLNNVKNCANLQANRLLYQTCTTETIVLARLYLTTLVLVVLSDGIYSVNTFLLIKEEDQGFSMSKLDCDITFHVEPTALRFEDALGDEQVYLTVCFADDRIAIWKYTPQGLLSKMSSFSLSTSLVSRENVDALLPYDCSILVHESITHVLVVYHNGHMKHFEMQGEEPMLKSSRRLSNSPLKFLEEVRTQGSLYFSGEHSGRISMFDHELVVDKIVFPDRRPETIIHCLNPFFDAQTDVQKSGLLCYEAGWLTFYTIPQEISQTQDAIDIAETPRRLLHVPHLDCYVLATDRESIRGTFEKAAKTGANICIVQNGLCVTQSPLRDSRKETEIFRSGDNIYAMVQWKVIIHGKERSWTVVGSSRRVTRTAAIEGRLTVLRLKQSGNKIDVRKEFSPSYSSPIYALCVFDETSLVLGHGDVLEVTMLDIDSRALATQSTTRLRSSVISIQVFGEYIFVATQKDSIMIFHYVDKTLKLVAADPYPRLSISLSLIDETTLVLTDKLKNLTIYNWCSTTQKLTLNCTIAMPTVIVRAKRLPVPRLSPEDVSSSHTPDRHVILAVGLDGTLHAVFRVLSNVKTLIDNHVWKESNNLFRTWTLPKIISTSSEDEMRTLLDEFELLDTDEIRKLLVAALTRRTTRLLA